MKARQYLRLATATEHERVDDLFSRFDLGAKHGYAAFLCAQAAAMPPIEHALDGAGAARILDDWPDRKRTALLRADLADLAVTEPELFPFEQLLTDKASVFGAIYVLEGSRLGGALLKRQVGEGFPRRFLDARQSAGGWQKLLKSLDTNLIRQEDLDIAATAARQVFARFEEGARRQLER